MRLLRHNEIYRSDVSLTSGKLDPECRLLNGSGPSYRTHQEEYALPIVCDEFRPGIPRSGWSPPEPVFASPARPACHGWTRERKRFSANGDLSLFKLSHLRGAVHETFPELCGPACSGTDSPIKAGHRSLVRKLGWTRAKPAEARQASTNRRKELTLVTGGSHVCDYRGRGEHRKRGRREVARSGRESACGGARPEAAGTIHAEGCGAVHRRCDRCRRSHERVCRRESRVRDDPSEYCIPGRPRLRRECERRLALRDRELRDKVCRGSEQRRRGQAAWNGTRSRATQSREETRRNY